MKNELVKEFDEIKGVDAVDVLNKWEQLLIVKEEDYPRVCNHYGDKVLQYFKLIFLQTLNALLIQPKKQVIFPAQTRGQYEFANAYLAMGYLLHTGIKVSTTFSDRRYNLWNYMIDFKLFRNPNASPALKELLLMLPGSEEFTLKGRARSILLEFLPSQERSAEFDHYDIANNSINIEYNYTLKPLRRGENPLLYFCETPTSLTIVAIKENDHAISFLQNKLPQFLKDEDKFLQREINVIEVINFFGELLQDLLPYRLYKIIAEYEFELFFKLLARSLSEQLTKYQKDYLKEFKPLNETNAVPDVFGNLKRIFQAIIESRPIELSLGPRHFDDKEYEYKPIKGIDKLIMSVKIDLGSSEMLDSRLHNWRDSLIPFYLLKFFKDLAVSYPKDLSIDKFILDLLKISNIHRLMPVKTSQLVSEYPKYKTVLELNEKSSMKDRMIAEKELNESLHDKHGEDYPINYVRVINQNELHLFVKLSEFITIAALSKHEFTICVTLFYIAGLLQQMNQNHLKKWSSYKEDERSKIIKQSVSDHYGIRLDDIKWVRLFNNNVYQLKVSSKAYSAVYSAITASTDWSTAKI